MTYTTLIGELEASRLFSVVLCEEQLGGTHCMGKISRTSLCAGKAAMKHRAALCNSTRQHFCEGK
jgi:hypothetical protein